MSNTVRAAVAALGTAAVISGAALAIPAIADAANPSPGPSAGAGHHPDAKHMGAEKELTGTTADKVKAAVLARLPGATVHRMSSEDADDRTGAAYEAHVTKAGGGEVEVLLDKNFKVLSTKTDTHHGRPGGPGGPGRPGGPHGRVRVALSGAAADRVQAAVLARFPSATVDRMSAENAAETTGAAYEAHARKADGTHVEVLLDKNFTILVTRTMPAPR